MSLRRRRHRALSITACASAVALVLAGCQTDEEDRQEDRQEVVVSLRSDLCPELDPQATLAEAAPTVTWTVSPASSDAGTVRLTCTLTGDDPAAPTWRRVTVPGDPVVSVGLDVGLDCWAPLEAGLSEGTDIESTEPVDGWWDEGFLQRRSDTSDSGGSSPRVPERIGNASVSQVVRQGELCAFVFVQETLVDAADIASLQQRGVAIAQAILERVPDLTRTESSS